MNFKILIILICLWSCKIRQDLDEVNSLENIVQTAIIDFVASSNNIVYKNDSVFTITAYELDENVISLSFYSPVNKYIVIEGRENRVVFPTNYLEVDNKIFFWDDVESVSDKNVISKLVQYNQIDTIGQYDDVVGIIDHTKKAMHYYFCKSDISNFKKIKTTMSIGAYKAPKLNCR